MLAFMNFIYSNESKTAIVQLQVSLITHGLRSSSGVIDTMAAKSVSACILFGTSLPNCHAIHYHVVEQTCGIISSHGAALQFREDDNYIFAALNNSHLLQHTGMEKGCAVGPVQWKEQYADGFVAYPNVVYSNDESKCGCVCKIRVGDSEIPGFLNISTKECHFCYNGLGGTAGLYRTLLVDTQSDLAASWLRFNVGNYLPAKAFVGGFSVCGTPLYVCRAQIGFDYYTGYYDPQTEKSNIHRGTDHQPTHPADIELLIFSPNGPVSSAPTMGYPCPRYQVNVVSSGYEMAERCENSQGAFQ